MNVNGVDLHEGVRQLTIASCQYSNLKLVSTILKKMKLLFKKTELKFESNVSWFSLQNLILKHAR